MEDDGKNPSLVNGANNAKVDANGQIQSAEITIFNGSYKFSPQGAPGGNTPQQFENRVFAHESAHVGGNTVRTDAEINQMFGGTY